MTGREACKRAAAAAAECWRDRRPAVLFQIINQNVFNRKIYTSTKTTKMTYKTTVDAHLK